MSRRTVEDELDELHAERVAVHTCEVWPADWRDWLRAWDGRLTLRQQSRELHRLYGVVYPHSTIRNLRQRNPGTNDSRAA